VRGEVEQWRLIILCVRTTVDVINFFNYEKWIFDFRMTMSFLFLGAQGFCINQQRIHSLFCEWEEEEF